MLAVTLTFALAVRANFIKANNFLLPIFRTWIVDGTLLNLRQNNNNLIRSFAVSSDFKTESSSTITNGRFSACLGLSGPAKGQSDGCAVGGDSTPGSGFRASEPGGNSPRRGLSTRVGSFPGPPESRRAVSDAPGQRQKLKTTSKYTANYI